MGVLLVQETDPYLAPGNSWFVNSCRFGGD